MLNTIGFPIHCGYNKMLFRVDLKNVNCTQNITIRIVTLFPD